MIMGKVKLMIVDDHDVVRAGLKLLIKPSENVDLVADVENAEKALELIDKVAPNVVISDISMPNTNGIDFTKILKKNYPDISVIILSMHNDDEYVVEALEAGAMGYLPKDSNDEEIINAINTVANGKMYYSSSISDVFAKKILRNNKVQDEIEKLTERELEVLHLIVEGYSNKEIAEKLFVSKRTVDNHRTNFMKKISANNTADIVRIAFLKGLVPMS